MTAQDLKNSILQLAVQGKLVPQNPDDEPASVLLEKIKAEKAQLVKDGKMKQGKPLPAITEDEIPFEIPESWCWCRVVDIAFLNSGNQYDECSDGILYIKVADMNLPGNQFDICTSSRRANVKATDIIPVGSIIFPKRGGAISTNKKRFVIREPICVDSNTMAMTVINGSILPYLSNWFNSIDLGKLATGTSVPQINNKDIYPLLVPLPPLAEQQRIVKKIEELLPMIETYGKAESELTAFNNRFPDDLKKSVLQYAVQGKLVEQRPEEGTGEELYQQILSEKQRLIKAGTIRKEKPLTEIAKDEKPFDIPEGWAWAKLGSLFSIERGSSPRPIQAYFTTSEDGVNWIKIGDSEVGAKYITSTSEKITHEGSKKSRFVNIGDFIISNSMSFGRPYIMAINGYVHDGWNIIHIMKCKNGLEFNKDYLYYVLSSSLLVEQMKDKAAGGVVKNVRSDSLRELIIPLPPLSEQQRIVEKAEELLQICDRLN